MTKQILIGVILASALAGSIFAGTTAAPAVNINTATAQELQLLPRVGPALAKRIVDFRTANGPFKVPEELTRVKGVGEKSFALLQPHVSVSGATTLKEKLRGPRAAKPAASKAQS